MSKFYLAVVSTLAVAAPLIAVADGFGDAESSRVERGMKPVESPRTITDSRLPPILPGQEVNTGGGRSMRVWTTTGPVPVASPPAAPQAPTTPTVGDVDVLIDNRAAVGR